MSESEMTSPKKSRRMGFRYAMLRRSGGLRRLHTVPLVKEQSVAEHCWNVVQLYLMFWPDASAKVLSAALNHDFAEVVTGDIPSPFLKAHDGAADYVADASVLIHERWEVTGYHDLGERDRFRLRVCDSLELAHKCLDERNLGNGGMGDVFEDAMQGAVWAAKKLQGEGDETYLVYGHIAFVKGQWGNGTRA